jgi:Cu2+-exporting ATPase
MAVRNMRVRDGADAEDALVLAASLARHSLHPVSRALAVVAPRTDLEVRDVREHAGRGVEGSVDLRAAREASTPWVPASAGMTRVRLGSEEFTGGAGPGVHLAVEDGWLASWELVENLRDGAEPAITALRNQGVQLQILSGDQPAAVERIARRLRIRDAAGAQTPQQKLDHVARLQQAGHRVAMVGDGMNDGPVLARADISIAIGQAVPVAQARCDFIVQGGRLDAVALLLRQCTRARRVVRQNIAWAAGYNAVCVPLALSGLMPPWLAGLGMAASSLLVVLNAARLARLPELS